MVLALGNLTSLSGGGLGILGTEVSLEMRCLDTAHRKGRKNSLLIFQVGGLEPSL